MTIQEAMKYLQNTPNAKVRAPTGIIYSHNSISSWQKSNWDGDYVFGTWEAIPPEVVKFTTVTGLGGINLRPFIDSGDLKSYAGRRIKVTVEVLE